MKEEVAGKKRLVRSWRKTLAAFSPTATPKKKRVAKPVAA